MTRMQLAVVISFGFAAACGNQQARPRGDQEDEKAVAKLPPATDSQGAVHPQSAAAPAHPLPIVQLEPVDLTTSVGASPLHILVSNAGDPVGDDLLKRIGDAVELRTWPELDEVSTTMLDVVDTTGAEDEDQYGHVYLSPTSPLSDRWYALYVKALPEGVTWPPFAGVLSLKDGSRVSRFRVGSDPVVASVRAYVNDPQKRVVYIDFSERITGAASLVGMPYADGKPTGCRAESLESMTVSSPSDGSSGMTPAKSALDGSAMSIALKCTGAVDLTRPIRLNVDAGLRSTSGPAVGRGRALQLEIGPSAWTDLGATGGKLFRPGSP